MRNILLSCMLISYLVPIFIVYFNYCNNESVSNIICNPTNQYIILLCMIIMGFFTLLYEWNRQNILSGHYF